MQTNTETQTKTPAAPIHRVENLQAQPAVYVGTFEKYNNGDLTGAWLDVSQYPDREAFYEACAALHADEDDPEFMFQDFQGFPAAYHAESWLDANLWDWLDLDDDEKEMVEAYHDNIDRDASIECIKEAYYGTWDSAEEWAENWLNDSGLLSEVPEALQHYIDFEAYARDARMGGDVVFVDNGYRSVMVFANR